MRCYAVNPNSMKKDTPPSLSYQDAGVDIAAGNRFVDAIKPIAAETQRPEILASIGGFSSLIEIPMDRFRQPILVAATDGVGTKLKLANLCHKHDTIGIDLVAMCVNDIVVQGAEPLFFLDYYATGSLDPDIAIDVVKGIATGCKIAGAALSGGETAEMPGLYQGKDYDLAGFCVGIVEKSRLIDFSQVAEGNIILGLASSGPHSNGYSLIRKILDRESHDIDQLNAPFGEQSLGQALLTPTRIYVKSILNLIEHVPIHAIAHITGGGLIENIPRVLPPNTCATLDQSHWQIPPIFQWLQERGNVAPEEMHRTFNCGIGMIVCIAKEHQAQAIDLLSHQGETVTKIGVIEHSPHHTAHVNII